MKLIDDGEAGGGLLFCACVVVFGVFMAVAGGIDDWLDAMLCFGIPCFFSVVIIAKHFWDKPQFHSTRIFKIF